MRFIRELTEKEAEELRAVHRRAEGARERTRALAVLMSSRGHALAEMVALFGVRREAVSGWLSRWEAGGVAALADAPRAGRPPKVQAGDAQEAQLLAAAQARPADPSGELTKGGRGCRPAGRR